MMTIIVNLLLINLIIAMIFNSGFVDSIDEAINKKFPLHHLPRPFSCCLCSVVWASIIYCLWIKEFSLLTLTLCLANATLTSVTQPLLKTIENILLKIIEWINGLIWK